MLRKLQVTCNVHGKLNSFSFGSFTPPGGTEPIVYNNLVVHTFGALVKVAVEPDQMTHLRETLRKGEEVECYGGAMDTDGGNIRLKDTFSVKNANGVELLIDPSQHSANVPTVRVAPSTAASAPPVRKHSAVNEAA